ncbi:MAG: phosphotransferase [Microthrixaceae bacterium]
MDVPHRLTTLAPLAVAAGLDAGGSGTPATAPEHRFEAERTIRSLAETLARLHAVEVPAELRTDRALLVEPAELVDRAVGGTATPGPSYRHLSRERLCEILRDGAPASPAPGDLVLSHGHPTFAQLRFDGATPVGFDGWTRVGLADPHLDLAAAARDLVALFGPAPIHAFFEHYGVERPDPVRLDWYLLAHELGS